VYAGPEWDFYFSNKSITELQEMIHNSLKELMLFAGYLIASRYVVPLE
jgi:hypothetical protein